MPAYLDLESEVLEAIRDLAEPEATDPRVALAETVKGTLSLYGSTSDVFASHLRRLENWRRDQMLVPPPTLALLSVFSLAAKSMHKGEGMEPNNFYGRLAGVLDLSSQQGSLVEGAYRKKANGVAVSEKLWGSLNDWLEMLEGNRGLPTASALRYTHIGFPLSQALVRRTDRERFGDLFRLHSLSPGSSLPVSDMQNLIDEWVKRKPCPVSSTLKRLWESSSETKERITSIVLLNLESWDGAPVIPSGPDGIPPIVPGLIRVKAVMRTFPVPRVDLSLAVLARTTVDTEVCRVIGADRTVIASLELIPAGARYLALADPDAIDMATFLDGNVVLQRPIERQFLQRHPRRVVPMRYDDRLLGFVECERIQLGEEFLVLVRNETTPRLVKLLREIARPGFVVHDDLPGLPEGWTLFAHVQVFSSIPVEQRDKLPHDLDIFQAAASSQAVLQGGLRLPGNIAKWSSTLPPELRISIAVEAELKASITCIRPLATPTPGDREITESGAVLIWDLAREMLPDGDYKIVAYRDGKQIHAQTLRLRSADNPAVSLDQDRPSTGHDLGSPGFGLITTPTTNPGPSHYADRNSGDPNQVVPPRTPRWYAARKSATQWVRSREQVRFPVPDESSCVVTGAHYMCLETATSTRKTLEGTCAFCGLVKQYPATQGKKKSPHKNTCTSPPPRVNVSRIAPVRTTTAISWEAIFDAVCHVGSGSMSALDRISSQTGVSNCFGNTFPHRLELLGHIEIERSPTSFRPKKWEIADPLVAGLADGSVILAGFRNERMLTAIEDYVWTCKGTPTIDKEVDAPHVLRVVGLSEPELEKLAILVERTVDKTTRFIPRAADQLCDGLPSLTRASKGLPVISPMTARRYERWNPHTAQFEQVAHARPPGAFRLTNFDRTYIYRGSRETDSTQAVLGDAQIVKYLAAADAGRSLLGYDPETHVLYVPIGADLPGLYGRAAVFASGFPPTKNIAENVLEYRGISSKLASRLHYLLMS